MIFSDPLSMTLAAQGWFIANKIWTLLNVAGFSVLAFAFVLFQVWYETLLEGADEGNKGKLAIERGVTKLILAGVVMVFGVLPTFPVKMATLTYDESRSEQCGVALASGHQDLAPTAIDGEQVFIPLLWALWHGISQGITTGSVAAIPCTGDLTRSMLQLDEAHITSPLIRQEVNAFYQQCYTRAKAALNTAAREGKVPESALDSANWIAGETFFKWRDGAKFASYHSLQAEKAVLGFPYNAQRDDPIQRRYNSNASIDERKAYPMCSEWWMTREMHPDESLNSYAGLKFRIYVDLKKHYPQITEDLIRNQGVLSRLIHGETTSEQRLDMYLERVLRPKHISTDGRVSYGYGNRIQRDVGSEVVGAWNAVAGGVGLTAGATLMSPVFFIIRESLPMIQSLLIMVIIIASPIVLVCSLYRVTALMSLLLTYFGLVFLRFWWELCRSLDTKLFENVYNAHENFNPITMLNNSFDDAILRLCLTIFYLVILGAFFGLLGYAGYRVNGISMDNFTTKIEGTTSKGVDITVGTMKSKMGN